MATKDNFLKARITDEQVQALDKIVKELQITTPEANVSASSIARYAIEKYINEYAAKKNGQKVFCSISLIGSTVDDIEKLYKYLSETHKKAIDDGNERVSYMILDVFQPVLAIMPQVLETKYGKKEG